MTADRLEELRRYALTELDPAASVIALDNVLRLAVGEIRKRDQGAEIVHLRRDGHRLVRIDTGFQTSSPGTAGPVRGATHGGTREHRTD